MLLEWQLFHILLLTLFYMAVQQYKLEKIDLLFYNKINDYSDS